jgi:oligopeptide/dipeptide ABC transporter ATP-binding protein
VPPPVLAVERLRVAYRARGGVVQAINEASLEIAEGEAVGLVGESGSGKSTLARALLGLLPEGAGRVEGGSIVIAGRDLAGASQEAWETVRGNPVAIVFQDPLSYLNPVMRIGRQIAESVARHGDGGAAVKRVAELLELVKLPARCVASYPHELSGGMRQRALLAIALGCRPRLLVADEPTTALDVTTQAEILALLRDLRRQLGMALLLISHDLGLVAQSCDRVYVMYAGRTIEWGPAHRVFATPAHPYTAGLLLAAQAARNEAQRFVTIEGDVPNLAEPIVGCPFAPRCTLVLPRCSEMPPAFASAPGHEARCWRCET